jgi:hypothetical protein
MNLTIVTACWKRPEVFELFAQGVKMLQKHFKGRLNITVTCSGSEGEASKKMVEKHGFTYIEIPNQPLGRKMNKAALAAKQHEPDYCLFVGSDDIMGVDLMEKYYEEMQKGTDYVYVKDWYFFDLKTRKGLYWAGYDKKVNRGHACGAGRLLSKRIVEALEYKPWYDNKLCNLLDTGFDRRYRGVRYLNPVECGFFMRDFDCFGLDIKTSTNMTPFAKWDNSKYIDGKKMLFDNLPKALAKKIYG